MASRKMTFTLPDDLASSFTRRVPARDRSRYVADAIAEKLAERERRLIHACEMANQDPDVREIESEMDSLTDAMQEPWQSSRREDATAR
jgi:metal-responsive CopG/Arc/MetJ family transcriptional regulator